MFAVHFRREQTSFFYPFCVIMHYYNVMFAIVWLFSSSFSLSSTAKLVYFCFVYNNNKQQARFVFCRRCSRLLCCVEKKQIGLISALSKEEKQSRVGREKIVIAQIINSFGAII